MTASEDYRFRLSPAEHHAAAAIIQAQADRTGRRNWARLADRLVETAPEPTTTTPGGLTGAEGREQEEQP